jgi:hypothetical protein
MPLNTEAIVDIQNRPSEYNPRDFFDYEIDNVPNSGVLFN